MADFDICYEWLIDNEDPSRKYAIVPDPPPGSHAISGINSHYFPDDYSNIASVNQAQRGERVKTFYHVRFWNRWFDQLTDNEVAKRVFDAAVNMGSKTAVALLQMAVELIGGIDVKSDGEWGPSTLYSVNHCQGDMLAAAFRRVRTQHYREIVLKHPEKGRFLEAWLVRAGK